MTPRALPALLLLAACGDAGGTFDDSGLKDLGVLGHPPLDVDPERPLSGNPVTVVVDPGAPGPITLTASGAGCGSVAGGAGTDRLETTGAAGQDGACRLTATVSPDGGDPYTLERVFRVQSTDPVLPPFDVPEGVWRPGTPPGATGEADGPTVAVVTGPTTFINGATLSFDAEVDVDGPLVALVVTFDGYDGTYVVPVGGPSEGAELARALVRPGTFTVLVPARHFERGGGASIGMGVQGLDARGRLSAPVRTTLSGEEVGTGDVQVGVSWGSATDVDLHVTEPDGTEIYYGLRTSPSGGQLDLDSNPGCLIDGVNHENVFWPTGQSPDGDYAVSVQMFADCDVGSAAGTVTLTYCGEGSPRIEPFGLGPTGSSQSFTFRSDCGGGKRVSGRVRYEDFAATERGYLPGAFVPARFVGVRVLRESDGVTLAEGATDAGGFYDLPFVNDGEPGVRVEIRAESPDARYKHSVRTQDESLYAWLSEDVLDDGETPQLDGVDLDVPDGAGAGALNAFDVGVRSADVARLGLSRDLDPVVFVWEHGKGTPGNDPKGSHFSATWTEIRLAGLLEDPDIYDDWVIAHEYGHFLMATYSRDDSKGPEHLPSTPSVPATAWSEGWATWFASQALGATTYIDLKANGVPSARFDIESLPLDLVPLGNSPATVEGDLSEAVVSAVLLDLSDDTNEAGDEVSLRDQSAWWVFRYRMDDTSPDRGQTGRDLVDFLDAWICEGLGELELRGNVLGLHQLSYDFTPTCP